MTEPSSETLHATAVAIDGRAVLIEGRSGAGKSDLALRLIDRGAVLISDDRTIVTRRGDALFACAPERIAGRIEVRGVGIVAVPHCSDTSVALLVVHEQQPLRMPEPGRARLIAGVAVPMLGMALTEASTPIKVEYALAAIARSAIEGA